MSGASEDERLTRRRVDVVVTALVAVTAYLVAHRSLSASFRVAPGIEDLLATCTGRLGWMPDVTALYALPQWTAFVARHTEVFPCSAIAGIRFAEIGSSWELQRYFHLALYGWFRLTGATVAAFLSFQSLSYAITCGLAYLTFRLGMRVLIAAACAAALIWSPTHLAIAAMPIEYAKAPWAIAVILLCGSIVRGGTARTPWRATALALGLVAGLGIGFKTDLIALVPFAILTPLLFMPVASGRWRRRAIAVFLVVAGVVAGGGTMLYRNFFGPAGSLLPVQVIGGQDWQTESMHASSPLYDSGVTWDDPYVDAMINSYGRRIAGTTTHLRFYERDMQEVATRVLLDIWTTFPGDLVLRVIAAIVRVLWLNGLTPLLAVAGLFVVLCRDLRQGWFVLFLTVYVGAVASLIFQRRHIFHLEVIPWWLAGVVAEACLLAAMPVRDAFCERDWRGLAADARARFAAPARAALISLLACATVASLAFAAARQYQDGRVLRLVDRYQQVPRDVRPVTRTATGAGTVSLAIGGLGRDHEGPHATGDYLAVSFRCRAAGAIHVRSTYRPPVPPSSNWNRDFNVLCSDAGSLSTLMMPVYQQGASYRFDGLRMSEADADAVSSAATVRDDAGVTLWPDLIIPADWRTRRWFEQMIWPPAMPL